MLDPQLSNPDGLEVVFGPEAQAADGQCFYRRTWSRTEIPMVASMEPMPWVLFLDNSGLGHQISRQLEGADRQVIEVTSGRTFARIGKRKYCIRPGNRSDYDALIVDIAKHGSTPHRILHLWSLADSSWHSSVDETVDLSFNSLLYLVQSLEKQALRPVDIAVITSRLQCVAGEVVEEPVRGICLGVARLNQELFPGISFRAIDCDPKGQGTSYVAMQVITELGTATRTPMVAFRGDDRWVETLEPIHFSRKSRFGGLKRGGVYLITGGQSELGLALAEYFINKFHARVVLIDAADFPKSNEWQNLLQDETAPAGTKLLVTKLRLFQEMGGEVLTICADIARQNEISLAIQLATEKFAGIDGVIYAAQNFDEKLRGNQELNGAMGNDGVKGALALKNIFLERPVDFFAFVSGAIAPMEPKKELSYEAMAAVFDAIAASETNGSVVSIKLGLSRDNASGEYVSMSTGDAASAVAHIVGCSTPPAITAFRYPLPKLERDKRTTAEQIRSTTSKEDVEHTLSIWWQELLGLDEVGFDEDFLDLGGNSLVGLQLFSKIKKTYGVNLKLATLSEIRTITLLAQLIRSSVDAIGQTQSPPRTWSPLVPVQPKGTRLSLFVISGIGGNVLKFHPLAYHLGEDQPIFGLLPRGLDGITAYHTRIEDVAADYVAAIRIKQPEGPYQLAGYSFGGIVAFEVAQQLVAQGGKIGMLALFDTMEWHYGCRVDRSLRPGERFHILREHLQNIIVSPERATYVQNLLTEKYLAIKIRLLRALGRPFPQEIGALEEMNTFAAASYYPTMYPGRLVLFRSSQRTIQQGVDDFLGWGNFAKGGVEVHHVPATHFNILQEPVVQVLAQQLRICLDASAMETQATPGHNEN